LLSIYVLKRLHILKDSYKYQGRRRRLAADLQEKGIRNEKVLEAIAQVPRHLFFLPSLEDKAYDDQAYPIDEGQTISQPYTVAYMTELLDPFKGMKVLEIGTGSGYQAAILQSLGAEVFTIERHEALYRKASEIFRELKLNIHTFWGDGSAGLKKHAPFDGIIVTAGAPPLAETLKEQLKIGGKLVMPVGTLNIQTMVVITRGVDNQYERREKGQFKFVPLLGKHGWQ
jgi:protein-L-isoaspartate(D-aspartate) O-methyltransferase